MDRICPFLALSNDHRTVVDGFDPEHACHALPEPEALDRARQAEQCLTEAHRQCDRYVAFLGSRASATSNVPAPAADALIARTRLILDPEARGLRVGIAPLGLSPRRWLVAGGVAAVGVAAAATAVAGGFDGLVTAPQPSGSTPALSSTPSPQPVTTPQPTLEATQVPSTLPASPPASPAATPEPSRSATASTPGTQTSYVVQQGDTLSLIAERFGTSVGAIQEANGLSSDVINIGQELVIP